MNWAKAAILGHQLRLFWVGMGVAAWQDIRKEQLKNMKSDMIANGSVFTDFTLVSYDVDSGRMLIKKQFDDGSEWLEPVAISIPDLFFMFKTEGIDPTEMTEELCFEFHKVKIKVGVMTITTITEDDDLYSDTYYYSCYAVRE